jgi:hypothetical protein
MGTMTPSSSLPLRVHSDIVVRQAARAPHQVYDHLVDDANDDMITYIGVGELGRPQSLPSPTGMGAPDVREALGARWIAPTKPSNQGQEFYALLVRHWGAEIRVSFRGRQLPIGDRVESGSRAC